MELILLAGMGSAALLMLEFYDLMLESWSRQSLGASHEALTFALPTNCTGTQSAPASNGTGAIHACW